ncbi:hypothetical protein ONE63_000356 [Megalurothrips usitatus]|uniref:Uncharacterized protein n=1 Tax=Megalurothrips usitatus TaxID=439358 RepID=A0AAV7Y201_9NEOP|nr:hypothetical protein ONE63_000356 [Megalurothrips usitatus]
MEEEGGGGEAGEAREVLVTAGSAATTAASSTARVQQSFSTFTSTTTSSFSSSGIKQLAQSTFGDDQDGVPARTLLLSSMKGSRSPLFGHSLLTRTLQQRAAAAAAAGGAAHGHAAPGVGGRLGRGDGDRGREQRRGDALPAPVRVVAGGRGGGGLRAHLAVHAAAAELAALQPGVVADAALQRGHGERPARLQPGGGGRALRGAARRAAPPHARRVPRGPGGPAVADGGRGGGRRQPQHGVATDVHLVQPARLPGRVRARPAPGGGLLGGGALAGAPGAAAAQGRVRGGAAGRPGRPSGGAACSRAPRRASAARPCRSTCRCRRPPSSRPATAASPFSRRTRPRCCSCRRRPPRPSSCPPSRRGGSRPSCCPGSCCRAASPSSQCEYLPPWRRRRGGPAERSRGGRPGPSRARRRSVSGRGRRSGTPAPAPRCFTSQRRPRPVLRAAGYRYHSA